ncbi:MAG: hypothetical protein ACQEP8_05815 [Chlamydiota bacterium]
MAKKYILKEVLPNNSRWCIFFRIAIPYILESWPEALGDKDLEEFTEDYRNQMSLSIADGKR